MTVNVVPTAEQKAETQKQEADAHRKAAEDEKLVSYTGDLVLVGLVQFAVFLLQLIAFVVQASYMRQSAAETRKMTEAAERVSRDQIAHAHQVERAYMSAGGSEQQAPTGRLQNLPGGLVVQELGPTGWFQFDVNNHGKTPAEIIEYGYGWCEVDKVANLPEFPNYRWIKFRDQIGPGTQSRGIKRIKIPPGKPVIFGRIGYKDIFGKCHSHGFMQEIGKPITPPHSAYIETDPDWDVPNVGKRDYQEEEPQS